MQTKITDLLGIQIPCFQGAMAWIADADLASAVSNAGGLGIIAAGSAPVDWVREQVRKAKSKTVRPFGLNIMLMSPTVDEVAQVAIEENVQVVTTGAGNPGKYIPAWKEAGIKVIPVIASAAQAIRMERTGADAVVAEGCEAGGHIGELTTMALTPQVVDAVSIPVITAGGIADGRGIAAAFMLGAQGVQIGTRFLVANECNVHENYKQSVLKCGDIGTTVTGRTNGSPVRVIKNQLAREILKQESEKQDPAVLEEKLSGTLRLAVVDGDAKKGSVMAGQVAGMVTKCQPVQEIMDEMFGEAKKILQNIPVLLTK